MWPCTQTHVWLHAWMDVYVNQAIHLHLSCKMTHSGLASVNSKTQYILSSSDFFWSKQQVSMHCAFQKWCSFDKCVLILHFDPLLWPQIMRIVGLPTFLLTQRRNELPSWKIYGSWTTIRLLIYGLYPEPPSLRPCFICTRLLICS